MKPQRIRPFADALHRYRTLWVCVLLVLSIAACYGQVRHFEFVNFDDPHYVSKNPVVQKGLTLDGVRWAFTRFHAANWHPVTWMSHMIDVELFGVQPAGHHWTNFLLHTANSLLLFLFLWNATGRFWPSAAVGALFGLHPLQVESVAWISQRKNVLSLFWGVLSLGCYLRFSRTRRRRDYGICLLFLAMGLMAKPTLVTFPLLLLLLDGWPLGRFPDAGSGRSRARRFGGLIMEKIPFFLLAAASSAVTLAAQQSGQAIKSMETFPIWTRLANAVVSYVDYLAKTAWPVRLSVFYPHPGRDLSAVSAVAALLLLLAAGLVCFRLRRRAPYLIMGYLWFLITLVPVIGIVQVGAQAMADRYMYLPLVGLFAAFCWAVVDLSAGMDRRRIVATAGMVAVLAALGLQTHRQIEVWHDSGSLFRHALHLNPGNWLAYNNLGTALEEEGNIEEATAMYQKVVQLRPESVSARRNLASGLLNLNRPEEALRQYGAVLQRSPDDLNALSGIAAALDRIGKPEEAILQYRRMLEIDPRQAMAWLNIAAIQMRGGDVAAAIESYRRGLEIDPRNALALYRLSWILSTHPRDPIRNGDEALRLAERLVNVDGEQNPLALDALAAALAETGDYEAAERFAERAQGLAEEYGLRKLAAGLGSRKSDYRLGKPFRDRSLVDDGNRGVATSQQTMRPEMKRGFRDRGSDRAP